jgi:hypothetical protein
VSIPPIHTPALSQPTPDALYRIDPLDPLRPFLASVVSDCDLWMYVSSTGGLAAGRRNEDGSLFPYVTDDQLHLAAGLTGPLTLIRVRSADGTTPVWKPFAAGQPAVDISRSLAKSVSGDRIVFEERHHRLGLSFSYCWRACDRFGWVRECSLASDTPCSVQLLDGLRDVLPANAQLATQRAGSCLINAYSTAELHQPSGLMTVALASQIVDRAEPCESLHANVVWHHGITPRAILISPDQLDRFARSGEAISETLLQGRRAAYFVVSDLQLTPGAPVRWRIVADARRSQTQASALIETLRRPGLDTEIDAALDTASSRLYRIVAGSDGSQRTGDAVVSAHHFSNALFNSFRGGALLDDAVAVPLDDFRAFLAQRNRLVLDRDASALESWPASMPHRELVRRASETGDANLFRLANEYLPLTFGRRHGDPSRPWNRFDIVTARPDGSPALNHEGNWRDIFQNWEALAASFPDLLEPIIAKFVNASTPDGFNPYRITRAGIDWEVPEPHNPWSHIGYWGDHSIVYLLRLLEASHRLRPDALKSWLDLPAFSYADVPYRLRSHDAICADPKHTIDFDWDAHRASMAAVERIGSDGRLVRADADRVIHVTLAEKLLVPALSKLSSLVAGAGIWMNTQRPEWNDANNALVGNGTSMVTLAYLRRYLAFVDKLLHGRSSITLRPTVARWLGDLSLALAKHDPRRAATDDRARRGLLDDLGTAFERYRSSLAGSFGTAEAVGIEAVRTLLARAMAHLDQAISQNRRSDGLYHAYNLVLLSPAEARVEHLDAMLEGQVAVLGSGLLDAHASAELVDAMFRSSLWREDQHTFMLYPKRTPTPFLEKSVVPRLDVPLLHELLERGDRSIVVRDERGVARFSSEFRNASDLRRAIEQLPAELQALARRDGPELLELYEQAFHHRAFTGRSGSMFGYEGIGCVYWHMVAKLLLAIQECFVQADPRDPDRARLASLYYRVRAGLGFNKTPAEYGAFPLDAYSHTPLHAGAQQPGMTGQVKEEMLTRTGELGVRIADGVVAFDPSLLRRSEFLREAAEWSPRCDGRHIRLEPGSLGFTVAGVPVVYRLGDAKPAVVATLRDGTTVEFDRSSLDRTTTQSLFRRDGSIRRIDVRVAENTLLGEIR